MNRTETNLLAMMAIWGNSGEASPVGSYTGNLELEGDAVGTDLELEGDAAGTLVLEGTS